jgi:steroid delta-isomerase-like uncharacterized protein
MDAEANKAAVRRFFDEVWNKGNMAAADEFLAPAFISHSGPRPPLVGADAYKSATAAFRAAVPDLRATLEDVIAEADRVVVRGVDHFTHTREFMGVPATGRAVALSWIEIFRLENGKAVEAWLEADIGGLRERLMADDGPTGLPPAG